MFLNIWTSEALNLKSHVFVTSLYFNSIQILIALRSMGLTTGQRWSQKMYSALLHKAKGHRIGFWEHQGPKI